jgi:hypothetical protein
LPRFFRVRDEFVAPELSIDGTAFSLNSLLQRISFAAHSMSTAEADVQARMHALIDPTRAAISRDIALIGLLAEHRDSEYLT